MIYKLINIKKVKFLLIFDKLNTLYNKQLIDSINIKKNIYVLNKFSSINYFSINFLFFYKINKILDKSMFFFKFINFILEKENILFFFEFKIVGLGFKLKKKTLYNKKILKIDIGFSHIYKINIPENIRYIKGRKKFFFVSNNNFFLKNYIKNIIDLRYINPYKIKGLQIRKKNYKLKQGKKQNKR